MKSDELVTKADLQAVKEEILLQLKESLGTTAIRQKKLLKSRDVLEMLDISPSSLVNMRVKGIIPYSKIGGTIFYNYDDIVSLLALNKRN